MPQKPPIQKLQIELGADICRYRALTKPLLTKMRLKRRQYETTIYTMDFINYEAEPLL